MPSVVPTNSPTRPPLPEDLSFRLRLHSEKDYCWQEECRTREYCAECVRCSPITNSGNPEGCSASSCKSGVQLWIQRCDSRSTKFEILRNNNGDLMKVRGRNLCMERRGDLFIILRPCDETKHRQWFKGFENQETPFTLRNVGDQFHRCMSQHHHPKNGEVLFLDECDYALDTNTGLWDAL